jgi:peptidoglycan/LPS O-acetylase OafA/YrhL
MTAMAGEMDSEAAFAATADADEEVRAEEVQVQAEEDQKQAELEHRPAPPKVASGPGKGRTELKREIELDFIRGIAILLVLDYHAPIGVLLYPFKLMGFAHFGWVGVDIFFVLSGFLVGGLLIKEWKVRGRIDSKRFLIRRGFKIWPQYYVFLGLNLVTGHRRPMSLLGNFLNIQNYVHGSIAHTWSLAVEEHAYLLLVLCLAVAARRKTRMRNLFFFLAGTSALVFAMRLVLSNKGYYVFPRTHTRIDGIIYGVMLAIIYHYVPDTFRRVQHWTWLWLATLGGALLYFRYFDATVPWELSLSWDFGSATGLALIMLLYKHHAGRVRPWPYRLVAFIGLYSYGIYLWHIAVREPLGNFATRLPHWISPTALAVLPIVGGILVGMLFTKLVEFPTLKLRDRLFPRRIYSPVGVPAEILEHKSAHTSFAADETSPLVLSGAASV